MGKAVEFFCVMISRNIRVARRHIKFLLPDQCITTQKRLFRRFYIPPLLTPDFYIFPSIPWVKNIMRTAMTCHSGLNMKHISFQILFSLFFLMGD